MGARGWALKVGVIPLVFDPARPQEPGAVEVGVSGGEGGGECECKIVQSAYGVMAPVRVPLV